jgi:hypothetical protein
VPFGGTFVPVLLVHHLAPLVLTCSCSIIHELTCSLQVAQAPPGTQACAFDIEAFHRTCPVLPDHKPFLVVCVNGMFYIDHTHPFGARSASSNSGQIGNATVQIWKAEGVDELFKYEDDFNQLRLPVSDGPFHGTDNAFSYRLDRDSSMALIAPLRIPWKMSKTGLQFEDIMTFIGFSWDFVNKRVSLPDKKRIKFLDRVDTLLAKANSHSKVSLFDVRQIHGSLVHVSFVHPEGSSHLPQISNFECSFRGISLSLGGTMCLSYFGGNDNLRLFLSNSVIMSLKWWKCRLEDHFAFRQLHPRPPLQDIGIYVDASTSWGIGIIIGKLWWSLQLSSSWKVHGRDICWIEAVALEIVVYFLRQMGHHNVYLLIHSDSNGAIGALSKGRSRNPHINLCARRTFAVSSSSMIFSKFSYIESCSNPADPLSRGVLDHPISSRLQRSFEIPHDLRDAFLWFHDTQ